MITTGLSVESPEGITFRYELASLVDRGGAYAVDLLVRAGMVAVLGLLLLLLTGPIQGVGIGMWLIGYFLTEWGYFVWFELVWDGQSPGKRLFQLRVVKATGHPIGVYDAVLRNLLRAADQLPLTYATGVVVIACSRRFARLGDLAAGTIVIHEPRRRWKRLRLEQLPVAQPAHRAATLSNNERRLMQEFLLRKDRLHPDRAEQLAKILAEPYREIFAIPAESNAVSLLTKIYIASAK